MSPFLAHLLVRLYPRSWRARYGTEFEAFLLTGDRNDLSALTDVVLSAVLTRITTRLGKVDELDRTMRSVMMQPSAFFPLAMSIAAVVLVLSYVARYGGGPVQDEGAVGHLWQLLMCLQIPIVACFAYKWLPRSPRQALYVLAQHGVAALTSIAVVFLFGLG